MKWVVFFCLFIVVCWTTFSRLYDIESAVQVAVVIDGKEVFRGSGACVKEKILNNSVVFDIGEGPMCMSVRWPKPVGTMDTVEVNTIP
jgi:hypothetical protein